MKRKNLILLTLLVILGCSNKDSDTVDNNSSQTTDDQPSASGTANVIQIAYPNLVQTGVVPTLEEVFLTNRDSYWICSFTDGAGLFFWQTVAYFYQDGVGESVFNNSPDGFAPDSFQFNWSGEQALSIFSESISNVTIFNFRYTTDPAEIVGDNAIYHFAADHSLGGLVVCSKNPGEW